MKELEHLKTYKMKLTTLSPVFIGGGETILGIQTEDDFKNKILKNDKVLRDKWIDYFMNFQTYKHNKDKRIPRDAKTPSLSGFLRFVDNKEFKPNKKSNSFITTLNNPYIPGSSIKGAVRTALIADLIETDYNIKKSFNPLKNAEEIVKKEMQYIQISDSFFDKNNFLETEEMTPKPQKIIDNKSIGYSPDKNSKPKKLFSKEFVYEDNETIFYITIDTKRSKYKIDDILNKTQKFYKQVFDENKKALEGTKVEICSKSSLVPNINIGGQSGYNTKVVLRALTNSETEYVKKKKEILSKQFQNHSHDKVQTAPRYLKFTTSEFEDGSHYNYTLGWCNISVIE